MSEQDSIGELLAGAARGCPGVLILRGAAGIGKSALLNYAESTAHCRTLRVTGVESEAALPYAALQVLLRPVLGKLVQLPQQQANALGSALGLGETSFGDRFLVGLATLNLLTDLATEGPLLCLIDDAQWVDQESADALLFAARRLHSEPVSLILAARDDGRAFFAPGVPELRLPGLDRVAARALADSGGALAPVVRDQIVDEAGGNPLALLELTRMLTPEQRAGAFTPFAYALGVAEPPSDRVLSGFRERIRALSPSTRLCLLVAALEDTGDMAPVSRTLLALGHTMADFAPAERADLVRVTITGVEFRHPLVRTATRLTADIGQRMAAHAALAENVDDDRRVWHLAAIAVAPDAVVADELDRAAERARRRGGQIAVSSAYARAAELTPDPGVAVRRWAAASSAAWDAGIPLRAAELVQHAATHNGQVETTVTAELARVRAALAFDAGRPLDAARLLHEAIQAMDVAGRGEPSALTMLGWAAIYIWSSRPHPDQIALARETEQLTPVVPGPLGSVHALVQDIRLLLEGDPLAVNIAPRGLGQLENAPFDLHVLAAYLSFARGDVSGMVRDATCSVDLCRSAGRIGRMPQAMMMLAIAELASGRHRAARATAFEARRLAEDVGQPYWKHYLAGVAAWVHAVAGDEQQCHELAAEAKAEGGTWMTGHAWATWALVALDSGLGRYEQVLARLDKAATGPARHGFVWRYAYPDYVEAAVRTGDPRRADPLLGRFANWARATGNSWSLAVLHRCHALLTDGDAADLYEQALRLHEQDDQPFEHARTELVYGEWLRRHNHRAEARAQLASALSTFDRLGAAPWAERAAVELRASGVSSAAQRTGSDPLAALTPQELQVIRLAATGATNREIGARLFLSARTVAYHLYKAFPKLGVSSRAELARYVTT
ncbi:LuxR family transcriptional regulator [Nocardia sp. NBC_01503]|uniref:LuxR family transcriptional regulator n=1 Tax=Nocardia sp. NBC_01503 TaxID=2975997 RepID=UPI002E7AC88E|nr:LuxR family transcriptional regulator [Nocardia sp. NBC_01503]WTL33224.1 LuxR family transcriptional regulator [Nocardia sp. NBC_01503]